MNGKLITVVIIILVIIIGGYFVYTNYMTPAPSTREQNSSQDNVEVQDAKVGEGEEAVPGSIVSVLYRGQLEDGTVFDSSEAHNNEPLKFTLGQPGLIPGFQIGVNGMKVGGERIMTIPPSLGYGAQEVRDPEGNLLIPANANLVFTVTLVSVEAAGEAPATTPEGQ